jgi:hypothetical protein
MSIRGRALASVALVVALGAAGCDSGGGAKADPSKTSSERPRPYPARRLASAAAACPAPRPSERLASFGDYGNLIGSSPVWAGFYANFDPRRGGYHIQRDAPRTGYGWRIKVLWVVAADVGGQVRLVATSISGQSWLWFKVGERGDRPHPQAILDPANPGIPPTGAYLDFPTYVFIPRAGCYGFDVAWPGGSWRMIVGLGR